jgi:DNA-binding NarL/FixJ family response regulator
VSGSSAESFGLFGREDAFAILKATLAQGGSVVMSGEPGMGKTSLVRAASQVAQRTGRRVLSVSPTQFDRGLPFAGLADLMTQCPEDVESTLPTPQRRALDVALQRLDPPDGGTDALAVPLAVRTLLTHLCEVGAVALILDDLQWLDQATAGSLAFALRRLNTAPERLSVVLSMRPEGLGSDVVAALQGAPEGVTLEPLDDPAIGQVLRRLFGSKWTQPISSAVARASSGNPFLALMIAQAMQSDLSKWSWSAQEGHDPVFPVPPGLVEILGEKVSLLPKPARDVLLLVSAAGRLTLAQLQALVEADVLAAALEAAADWEVAMVGVDSRVTFTHPMLASAIYDAATAGERRRAHKVLADALEDSVERARHRARTLTAPDAAIAEELEHAATVSASRGAQGLAGELLEAAAQATPPSADDGLRFRRQLQAVDAFMTAGEVDAALAALTDAEPLVMTSQAQAEVILRRVSLTPQTAGALALTEQGLALAPTGTFVHTLLTSLLGSLYRLQGNGQRAHELMSAAATTARAVGEPLAYLHALYGQLTVEQGWGLGDAAATQQVIDGLIAAVKDRIPASPVAWAYAFSAPWHDPDAAQIVRTGIADLLEAGRYGDLAQMYTALVMHLTRASRFTEAADALDEADRYGAWSASTFQEDMSRILVYGAIGDLDRARQIAQQAADRVAEIGSSYLRAGFLAQLGFIETSAGEWHAALVALREVADILRAAQMVDFASALWAVDYVDAALQVGALDEVAIAVEFLRGQCSSGHPEVIAAADRCAALLEAASGDTDKALSQLTDVVAHQGIESPFEAARSRLALGQVARRAGHKGIAAEALAVAAENFEQLGTPLWAERARREAGRVGLQPTTSALTGTERRVAELVALGHSNHEVAAEMFISVKTVEANLTRIYRKLSVRSRTELSVRLGDTVKPGS